MEKKLIFKYSSYNGLRSIISLFLLQVTVVIYGQSTLRIGNTGSLFIAKNGTLTAQSGITNEGNGSNFILASDANLIQINNTPAINNGSMTARRDVAGIKNTSSAVDYIYWSSPVSGQKTNGQGGFSSGTPADRFYSYRESNDRFYETSDLFFTAGRGYAVRAEDGYGSPYMKTYTFTGTPNNGEISFPITRSSNDFDGTAHGYNMVGNPYPSNISFDELYAGNNPNGNNPLIYNTAWFWTNNSYQQYQQGAGYQGNNYAVYNGTGGNSPSSTTGQPAYVSGIIKVGQGFIVQKKEFNTAPLIFKNSYSEGHNLRVNTTLNTTFFSKGHIEKNRFTLSLLSPSKIQNNQLIGYIDGATDGYEQDFDAEAFDDYSDLFYSVLEDKKLLIQGKNASFTNQDRVQLGAIFYETGTYTIALQESEGIFKKGQNIYLIDKLNNSFNNLSNSSYAFTTIKGNVADRFEIVYQPQNVLATGITTSNSLQVYKNMKDFVVSSPSEKIESVELYDVSGRLLYKVVATKNELTVPTQNISRGVLILQIKLKNGETISRKVRN